MYVIQSVIIINYSVIFVIRGVGIHSIGGSLLPGAPKVPGNAPAD